LRYEEAAPLVRDGDCIAVRSRRGPLAWLTRIFSRKPWTHTGTAVVVEGRVLVAEINIGRNHLVPLSHFADTAFDVFDCPARIDRLRFREVLLSQLDMKENYEPADLWRRLWAWITGQPAPLDKGGRICSAYTMRGYLLAMGIEEEVPIAAPADVIAWIGTPPKLEVRLG
jgi:hypothetical protein